MYRSLLAGRRMPVLVDNAADSAQGDDPLASVRAVLSWSTEALKPPEAQAVRAARARARAGHRHTGGGQPGQQHGRRPYAACFAQSDRPTEALALYRTCRELYTANGNHYHLADTLDRSGDILLAFGDVDGAAECWREAVTLFVTTHQLTGAEKIRGKLADLR